MKIRSALFGATGAALVLGGVMAAKPAVSQVNTVKQIGPGVYFHEGDLKGNGHCNNGWIIFEDYVLVVDANFPSGAKVIIPKIQELTQKPIRFAFDTHHHGDHAYANRVWVEQGAVPVGHVGVLKEMKKYESGLYGNKPGRWEDAAKTRKDVAESRLQPPTLLFPDSMIFDDGKLRVELKHFGVAHTHGDGWAWLPKERILFSGDACVNGPYNYVGDGNISQWIQTLAAARKLNPKWVVPGHGPMADGSLLADQQKYFLTLQSAGRRLLKTHPKPAAAQAQVATIKARILKDAQIQRYVGDFFEAQLGKAYEEAGGKAFPNKRASADDHDRHASLHDTSLRQLGAPTTWRSRLARQGR